MSPIVDHVPGSGTSVPGTYIPVVPEDNPSGSCPGCPKCNPPVCPHCGHRRHGQFTPFVPGPPFGPWVGDPIRQPYTVTYETTT